MSGPELCDELARRLREAQTEQRLPSSPPRLPAQRDPLAGRSGFADVEAELVDLAGDPVPHRLDHEDLHGGLHPPAARRGRALARRSAHGLRAGERARADARPHARARLGPPARAGGRDLGDDAAAEPRGARRAARPTPSSCSRPARGGTTRTWPTPCWARSWRADDGAAAGRTRCRQRVLDPLGLSPDDADGRAAGGARLLRRAVQRRVRLEPEPDLGGSGALGKLWSTVRDLATWGRSSSPATTVCSPPRRSRRWRTSAHGRPREAGRWRGGRASSSTARGDHVFFGHGGAMPGLLAGARRQPQDRHRRRGADEHNAGGRPEAIALELAKAAIEALPVRAGGMATGRDRPAEVEPLLGRWWSEGTSSSSRGAAAGSRRGSWTALRAATPPTSSSSTPACWGCARGTRARRAAARGAGRRRHRREDVLRDVPAAARAVDLLDRPCRRRGRRRSRPRRRRRSESRPSGGSSGRPRAGSPRSRPRSRARRSRPPGTRARAGRSASESSATAGIRKTATCGAGGERDLGGELDLPAAGDDDGAAVLGRVADDRHDHRRDEEVAQVRPLRRNCRSSRRGSRRRAP